jgi:hypothetical protein
MNECLDILGVLNIKMRFLITQFLLELNLILFRL